MKRMLTMITALLLVLSLVPAGALAGNSTSKSHVIKNLIKAQGLEARVLWMDLSANFNRLDTPEEVAAVVAQAKAANINTLILDVKNYTGFVAYHSQLAPHVSSAQRTKAWNFTPEGSFEYCYCEYPVGYDLLKTVLDAAHAQGLKVLAAVNVFSEGATATQEGPAFQHPDWQTVFYDTYRVARAANGAVRKIDGFDSIRYENFLVVYTPGAKAPAWPTNRWGVDVVVQNGVVTQILDRALTGAPAPAIPGDGFILSGHGTARSWILANLKVGDTVDVNATQATFTPAGQYTASFATFVNPIHPDVKAYELAIIRELAQNYDIDGITLDRARYSSIYADFSSLSRLQFEAYIGQPVANWPYDIFTVRFEGSSKQIVPGPLYKKWIEWRAKNIYDFFAEAKATLQEVKPDALFTSYVGSWYPVYYNEGVNWASNTYLPPYDWASEDYHKYGYARLLDFLMTGLYYSDITKADAIAHGGSPIYSVEGAAELSMEVTDGGTFVYGSIYAEMHAPPGSVRNHPDPTAYKQAVRMAADKTHGVMLFDLVHLSPEYYDWWEATAEVFAKPAKAPHDVPGLRKKIAGD